MDAVGNLGAGVEGIVDAELHVGLPGERGGMGRGWKAAGGGRGAACRKEPGQGGPRAEVDVAKGNVGEGLAGGVDRGGDLQGVALRTDTGGGWVRA